ncbi:helix-turn-helix transcriptional regulator [Actinoplanes sp. NBC_00393]|uniref:helix-turn-helix domain-containing protein n=1 Tax=Actinoplanes sp. NBC_00393 TaxID=2975953 RepID=UPI002E1EF10B
MTPAQLDALLNRETGDRNVLIALLHERISQWPWWDGAWRIIEIQEVHPRQIAERLHTVTIVGMLGRDEGATLPLSVFTRVAGSRLDRFEVRVGDVLIGPPVRDSDPHPFGSIFSALMDRRGISREEMARRCGLALSTVAKMRAGYLVPEQPDRLASLAAALEMPVGDLMAVAGLHTDRRG